MNRCGALALAVLVGLTGCRGREAEVNLSSTPTVEATLAPPTALPVPTAPGEITGDVPAMVNGIPIPAELWEEQVAQLRQYLLDEEEIDLNSPTGRRRLEEATDQLLSEMVDELLIRQAAERFDIVISAAQLDEVLARDINLAGGEESWEEWLADNHLTRDGYRAATELQLLTSAVRERVTSDLPATQPQLHLRHILLDQEEGATAILAQLEQGTDFAELAARHSRDPGSRESGGDLGWMPRGLLPPPLEAVAWSLAPGERSSIIESEFGFHIIELIELDPARPIPLETLQTLQQQAWDRWLDEQRSAATIESWPIR